MINTELPDMDFKVGDLLYHKNEDGFMQVRYITKIVLDNKNRNEDEIHFIMFLRSVQPRTPTIQPIKIQIRPGIIRRQALNGLLKFHELNPKTNAWTYQPVLRS